MLKSVATVIAAAILGATAAAPAAIAREDVEECVSYAMSEADAGILLANLACSAATFLDCYRLFRNEYGPQMWALVACDLR